ncbi:hypothetical protein [Neomegalonema perideroedes]|uniref:hypothetical protein n=1 Tax=Neomegalonema perideroedes TaxID=217219 RepID=UPI00036E0113|nr:hypothetical protein [Neomegalonema perideroedes]
MIDSSRSAARRREILADLLTRLRAYRTDPAARRRILVEPCAAFGLAEGAASPPLVAEDGRRAPPEAFGEAITGALLFGEEGAGSGPAPPPPLEARLTALGLRPAALLHGPEPLLAAWLRWAEAHGLWGLLSALEWRKAEDEGKGGYSNLAPAPTPARPGSGAMRSLLIAPDKNRALLGWMAVALGWDSVVGEVLGFPPCCQAFFTENWPKAVAERQGDLAPLVLEASRAAGLSGPYDWRLNLFARYFGAEILSHFPCRFDCAASLTQARRLEAGIRLIDPDLAARTQSLMRGLVLYSETGGVALAPGGGFRASGLEAPQGWLCSDPQGPLGRALASGAAPEPLPEGRARLAGTDLALLLADFSADGFAIDAETRETVATP